MEAHLASIQPTQVNKITSSCEICSGPHDTQYCMENPEQAFVEYASSRTDEAGGKWYTFKPEQNNFGDTYNPSWKSHPNLSQSNLEGLVSNFMASQDARLSKFKADFKKQQIEMTNKIDIVLKAITDRIEGALPSDTDLHLNLPVLEVLDHALIYNAMLDKYVESLELGKNGSTFVQGEVSTKMEDLELFTLPCRVGDSKPFDTSSDLGSCVNIIPLYLFMKLDIRLLEETDHIFGLADRNQSSCWDWLKTNMWESEDLIDNPINWDKPPKDGDGAWHAKIRIINPDGEEFTKTLQSIPTIRRLSERESPREIINYGPLMTLEV
ncbi:hypothetical protein Tco_0671719 [Tanacetum coccineum]